MPPVSLTPDRYSLSIGPSQLPPDAAYTQPIDGSEPPTSIAGSLVRSINPNADLSLPPDAAYIQPADGSTPASKIHPFSLATPATDSLVNQPTLEEPSEDELGTIYGNADTLGQVAVGAGKHLLRSATNLMSSPRGGDSTYIRMLGYDPAKAQSEAQRFRAALEPKNFAQGVGSTGASTAEVLGFGPEAEDAAIEDLAEQGLPKLISKVLYNAGTGAAQTAADQGDASDITKNAAREGLSKLPVLHQLSVIKNIGDAFHNLQEAYNNPTPETLGAGFAPITSLAETALVAKLGKEALVHELGEHMAEEHETHDGATFDPRTGESMRGKNLWAANIAPELSEVLDHAPTPEDIGHFVDSHSDLFHRNKNAYVGSHVDPQTGQHALEVVGLTSSKNDAAALAQQTGQRSIFHLGREQAEPVAPEPDAPALQVPIDTRFQALRSNAPAKTHYVGVHYSDNKFDVADGARRSGSGAEGERLNLGTQLGYGQDAPGGVYVYDKGARVEAPLVDKKHAYEIRGKYALANIADNPVWQAGLAKGKADAIAHGADDRTATLLGLNAAEHALQDAGFDGYYNPQQPHIKFLFGDHPVSPLGAAATAERMASKQPATVTVQTKTARPTRSTKPVAVVNVSARSPEVPVRAAVKPDSFSRAEGDPFNLNAATP